MNPYFRYQSQEASTSWTRIDMLLALYDGALERLDRAEAALQSGDTYGAMSLASRVQLIISEMAAGVRVDIDPDMGGNMLRLYEYCTHELVHPDAAGIAHARQILSTLREGFEAIRDEANRLERTGQLASIDQIRLVCTTA